MGGPPPVPRLEPPDWAIALCARLRRAAAAIVGPGEPVPPPPPPFPGFPPGNVNNPLSLEQVEALFQDLARNATTTTP